MLGEVETECEKTPQFIPPKKRSTGKKGAGCSSHVDYIKNVQGKGRGSPATSPSDEELDRAAARTSLVMEQDEGGRGGEGSASSATPVSLLADTVATSSTEQSRSPSLDLVTSADMRRKKKVNICTDNSDDPLVIKAGTSSSSVDDHHSESIELSRHSPSDGSYLTMTGTIKRGRKAGQSLDVKLNISREELEVIEANIVKTNTNHCCGFHVLVFSLICVPFVTLFAAAYNFYMGTMTWYNVFNHVSSSVSNVCTRIVFPPILILSYPFMIVLISFGLGVYGGVTQVSCDIARWKAEVQDLEKGFFGWLCSAAGLEDCSPYEVVILVDTRPDPNLVKETEEP